MMRPAPEASSEASSEAEAARRLLSAGAVRERCGLVFAAAELGALDHFALDLGRLDGTADFVLETIRDSYPDLEIPYHARWRHFSAGGLDRWAELRAALPDPRERTRAAFDLVVTSVLLDAGAGPDWRYRDAASEQVFARSEGLAVASFDAFKTGLFSADPTRPWRADGAALDAFTAKRLATAFQVTGDNPLEGLEGRAALLRGLGAALSARPDVFGDPPRLGAFSDWLLDRAQGGTIEAAAVLEAVLELLGPIWPGRITLGGISLGDTWRHPAARSGDAGDGLVPFHKLSQWLTYSLVEPLEDAGLEVTGLDRLTGLAEYRNGGLFVDSGVLVPRHDGVTARAHPPSSEVIVEWRALTVVLLDRLAERLRAKLGLDAEALPLAKVLEGGTWAAGRRIASEKRPGGAPPIALSSDGAVF
jgi:hypothetical protein